MRSLALRVRKLLAEVKALRVVASVCRFENLLHPWVDRLMRFIKWWKFGRFFNLIRCKV